MKAYDLLIPKMYNMAMFMTLGRQKLAKVIQHVRSNWRLLLNSPDCAGGNTNTGPACEQFFFNIAMPFVQSSLTITIL
jgi:hypothetical protein